MTMINYNDNTNTNKLGSLFKNYLNYKGNNIRLNHIEYIDNLEFRMCNILKIRDDRFNLLYYGVISDDNKSKIR